MSIPITVNDILRILNGRIEALESDPENIEHAYICIVVAAHLPERRAAETGVATRKARRFRDDMEAREPALRILRDLNNFAKHVKITEYSPRSSGLRSSDYVHSQRFFLSMITDDGFPPNLDINGYQVETNIDAHIPLLDVLKKASSFWEAELRRNSPN